MIDQHKIIAEVIAERDRQESKWGQQNHTPFEWLAILGEEVGEANEEALESRNFKKRLWDHKRLQQYRKELVQVAAVAVAMIECLDRGAW